MRIPTFESEAVPTKETGQTFTIPGQRRVAFEVPKTREVADLAMARVGDVMVDIAVKMREANDYDELQNAKAKLREGYTAAETEMKDPAFINNKNKDEEIMDFYDKQRQQRADVIKNKVGEEFKGSLRAKKQLDNYITEYDAENTSRLSTYARGKKLEEMSYNFNERNKAAIDDAIEKYTRGDFGGFAQALADRKADIEHGVAVGFLQPYEADGRMKDFQHQVSWGVENRRIDLATDLSLSRKDVGILKNLKDEYFKTPSGDISPYITEAEKTLLRDKVDSAINRVERELDVNDRVLVHKIQTLMKDHEAGISEAGKGLGGEINNLIGQVRNPQTKEILSMDLDRSTKEGTAMYKINSSIKGASPEQENNFLKQMEAEAQRGGEGAQYRIQARNAAFAVASKKHQMLDDNPAGYVVRELKVPADDMDRIIAEQKRLGVNEGNLRVMDKAVAKVQLENIMALNGKDIADTITALEQQDPRHFEYVMKGFQDVGMPMEIQMVGSIKDPKARYQIAEAFKLKPGVFEAAAGAEAQDMKKVVAEEINSDRNVDNLVKSIMATGSNATNVQKVENIKDIIRRTSYINIMKGDKPKDAVEKAAKMVIGDEFEFGSTYRVPKDTGLTVSQINPVLIDRKQTLTKADLYFPEGTPKQQQDWLVNTVRDGYWANAPDNDGWILIHPNTGQPVRGVSGQPIRMTPDDVRRYPTGAEERKSSVYRDRYTKEDIDNMEAELRDVKSRAESIKDNKAFKLQYDADQRTIERLEKSLKLLGR